MVRLDSCDVSIPRLCNCDVNIARLDCCDVSVARLGNCDVSVVRLVVLHCRPCMQCKCMSQFAPRGPHYNDDACKNIFTAVRNSF